MKFQFHTIVIGAGSGGLTLAIGLASAGKKVALVEKSFVGGDCTNYGCVPSKALLTLSRNSSSENFSQIMEKVRATREAVRNEEDPLILQEKGISFFSGEATFIDNHTIKVGTETKIQAKNIVIATGSSAQKIDILGVDLSNIITHKEIFDLNEEIKDIVIIGGGYIGCEISEALAKIGMSVSLLQRNEFLIPDEERESSIFMKKHLENVGVNVYTGIKVLGDIDKKMSLSFEEIYNRQSRQMSIKYDKIFLSLGRKPNLDRLGLSNLGVHYDDLGIVIDRFGRTNIHNIFAIGDVVSGSPKFTHFANYLGRIVLRNILFPFLKTSWKNYVLPSTLYTEYEVSRVGMSKRELLKKFDENDIKTYKIDFEKNDRSKISSDTQGFIVGHFLRGTGKLLGATVVCKNSGEILPILTLMIQSKISAYKISNLIFAYPTKSEIVKKLCDSFIIDTAKNWKNELGYLLKERLFTWFPVLFWVSIIIGSFLYIYITGTSYEYFGIKLLDFFSNNGYVGILLYIIFYGLRPLTIFPASIVTIMGGVLWGEYFGLLYVVVGSNLGGQLGYFLGKIIGKSLVPDLENSFLEKIHKNTKENALISVLGARLLFLPYDIVSFSMGILKVNWKYYSIGTLFGTLPGSAVFVLAGASVYGAKFSSFQEIVKSIDTSLLYFAAGIFILSIVTSKFLKKYFIS